jgi:hypothetical protein
MKMFGTRLKQRKGAVRATATTRVRSDPRTSDRSRLIISFRFATQKDDELGLEFGYFGRYWEANFVTVGSPDLHTADDTELRAQKKAKLHFSLKKS